MDERDKHPGSYPPLGPTTWDRASCQLPARVNASLLHGHQAELALAAAAPSRATRAPTPLLSLAP
ncbi:hypothetical protein HaLaN_09112 [Haematococcus lacustris]|uniref:Uncharacterized protein n=1 Tax=Haematococcus lacustris TaxID=44745 RepID=A0A699YVJ1_HAELA|nr:hypothetical protein HaLaN_09112 [Haematococcus lacustris]